jgi:hypothetical protein
MLYLNIILVVFLIVCAIAVQHTKTCWGLSFYLVHTV